MATSGFLTIKDSGLQKLLDEIERHFSPQGRKIILSEVGQRIADRFEFIYPEQTNAPLEKWYVWGDDGKRHKFKSLKAQKGFFAALKRGDIQVPYDRTQKLGESLRFELIAGDDSLNVRVTVPQKGRFNPEWVIGVRQARYFEKRTFWRPLRFMVEQQETTFIEAATDVFNEVLADLGRR
jgi:hypothetical protein